MFYRKYWEFPVLYSIQQLLMFTQFCSISFTLPMRNFSFINLHKFQTPIQKFDFGLVKFKLESETANIQYHSYLLYFIQYNVHTSIVRTWISQWFLAKKNFYVSRIISNELITASLFIIKLSYLKCTVSTEYYSIIFNVKKCALCLIKYSMSQHSAQWHLEIVKATL